MNKKISLGAALALMLVITAVTFSITMIFSKEMFSSTVTNITEREAMYDKLSEIDSYVRKNYAGTLDEDNLMDYIALGYVTGLGDKYSAYYPAEVYAKQQEENSGKIVGIGISASKSDSGFILVNEVYTDSPAEQVGIQPGDLIVKVNDIDVTMDSYEEAKNAVGGKAGTKLSLTVRTDNKDREIPEITRRAVITPTIYPQMYGNVGYIRISDFNDNTYDQFKKAVEDLAGSKGAQALVFDVRNNLGGLMDPALKMLDMLLPEGDIATATYKDGRTEVLATSDASSVNLPMVVLTNSKTASAAELFTQALRDYGKAKSVGTTTYGKGVMQVTHTLKDGSAVKITVAKYNPPTSANYDGVGLKPDFEVSMTEEQEKQLFKMDENSDLQLKKALEVTKVVSSAPDAAEVDPTIASDTAAEEPTGDKAGSDSTDTESSSDGQEDGSSTEDAATDGSESSDSEDGNTEDSNTENDSETEEN